MAGGGGCEEGGYNLLYGISKFPLIYVSSPPRGEDGGEGAKFC